MKPNNTYCSGKFLQYKKQNFTTCEGLLSNNVNCIIYDNNNLLFAGTSKGLCKLENDVFVSLFEDVLNGNIASLSILNDGTLAICMDNKLFFLNDGKLKLMRTFDSELVKICDNGESLWILTTTHLIGTDYRCKTDIKNCEVEGGKGLSLAVSGKTIYVATETNISNLHGKRMAWKNILPAFSSMPKNRINSINFDSLGYLWLGTDSGAAIYDNANLWLTPESRNTLPKNTIYKIVTDSVGGRYFASDIGVIYQKNGALKYFSADRWVVSNKVNDIAVNPDGSNIFAATDKGISKISSFESTLIDKAKHFENMIEKYHIRRGFTAKRNVENYDINSGSIEISDNDGLWTACYVAAESFRYATTGDIEALEKARRGMNALLFLTRITDIPGFTARAVRYPGEKGFGNGNHEWILSKDGSCEWKCETSSDEMTGHFFGFSTYYDLCANEQEKEEIKTAICAIMDHIIENNYRLVDHDGLPTTWAVWDPDILNLDDKWFFERGINSLELLAFLKVSYHMSGDKRYDELYKKFVSKYHYPLNVMQHKIRDAHMCHIDDNLGFLASITLLRLEDNEDLRALYLCGMEDHWQYERVERQPLFCFAHAIFTGRDADLVEGIQSLREIPYDLTHYAMENSKRKDLIYDTEQEEWHEPAQVKYPLPFDERNIDRPDGAGGFRIDIQQTHAVQEGTVFLLPYWIARYYGLITELDEE